MVKILTNITASSLPIPLSFVARHERHAPVGDEQPHTTTHGLEQSQRPCQLLVLLLQPSMISYLRLDDAYYRYAINLSKKGDLISNIPFITSFGY